MIQSCGVCILHRFEYFAPDLPLENEFNKLLEVVSKIFYGLLTVLRDELDISDCEMA